MDHFSQMHKEARTGNGSSGSPEFASRNKRVACSSAPGKCTSAGACQVRSIVGGAPVCGAGTGERSVGSEQARQQIMQASDELPQEAFPPPPQQPAWIGGALSAQQDSTFGPQQDDSAGSSVTLIRIAGPRGLHAFRHARAESLTYGSVCSAKAASQASQKARIQTTPLGRPLRRSPIVQPAALPPHSGLQESHRPVGAAIRCLDYRTNA